MSKQWMTSIRRTMTKSTRSISKANIKEQIEEFYRCFNLPSGEKVISNPVCELGLPHGSFYGILYITPNALCYLSDDSAVKVVIPICDIRSVVPCRYNKRKPSEGSAQHLPQHLKTIPEPTQKYTASLTPIVTTTGSLPPEAESDSILITMHSGETWELFNFVGAVRSFNLISLLLGVHSGLHRPQDLRPAGAGATGTRTTAIGAGLSSAGGYTQAPPSAPPMEMPPPAYRPQSQLGRPFAPSPAPAGPSGQVLGASESQSQSQPQPQQAHVYQEPPKKELY